METAEGTDYLFCAYLQRKAAKRQQLFLRCLSVRPLFAFGQVDTD